MKTELKVKLLQHLNQKKKSEGFTLIELLVVIIIIGILSAIALPSFLNQASKARASEARTNVGAINRSQQAYYLENQGFGQNITALGIGITNSDNYTYDVTSGDFTNGAVNRATSLKPDLKAYVGGVFRANATNTVSVLCEANDAAAATPGNTLFANGNAECPATGYKAMK
jgi:prepilin-type N-terminal cleavage/methylation domain-containing protein